MPAMNRLLILAACLATAGCGGSSSTKPIGPATTAGAGGSSTKERLQDQLIQSVADNLNRLDEFDLSVALPQLCDRLNQWVHQQNVQIKWKPDGLIATLPEPLRESPLLKTLNDEEFTLTDMVALQEAVWLRDIAKTARGNQLDDLAVAESLFDWTIRNIQLVEDAPNDGPPRPKHLPSEVLLLGRGTARERAWLFLLLLRQQGLEGVMLAIPSADGRTPPREWLPALVTDQGLYLFDTALGLPIPGPEGRRVATLAEVAADDSLLRKLDLSSQRRYGVDAAQLKDLTALVEDSPSYLARRMKLVEARLTGKYKVVLTAEPERLTKRLADDPLIKNVQAWPMPQELWLARARMTPEEAAASGREMLVFKAAPKLTQGRSLQFKGLFDGEKGAKQCYMSSRPSDRELAKAQLPEGAKQVIAQAKADASYWLGLIALEQNKYPVAIDYLNKRTLEAAPNGPWSDGARYALARVYEAEGEVDKAVDLYQSDSSPQKHGNRLRARRLKAQEAQPNKPADAEQSDPAGKSGDAKAAEDAKPDEGAKPAQDPKPADVPKAD